MRPSIAGNQFPRTVWHDNRRYLWNPVHKKRFKNRPEERVRLRVLEYLLEAGWSKNRISIEESIRNSTESTLRTDLICYSQDFKPVLLVECKAEQVSISDQTALQSARYNREVEAPFLLMTNGKKDYWYRVNKNTRSVEKLEQIPERFISQSAPVNNTRTYSYWNERGFAGEKGKEDENMRGWIEEVLNKLWNESQDSARHLHFSSQPTGYSVDHYYRIVSMEFPEDTIIAVTLSSTPGGETHILGILNREGHNEALVQINLDRIFAGQTPDTTLYSKKGPSTYTLNEISPAPLRQIKTNPLDTLKTITLQITNHPH